MTDKFSKETRSMIMSRIKNTNTKPEEIVRKFLFSKGFRYRKNVKKLPGCPDIVLPKYRTVIFVNGCFWHMHECKDVSWPSSNTTYWQAKLQRNIERDSKNINLLKSNGWKVVVVWGCELKKNAVNDRLNKIIIEIVG